MLVPLSWLADYVDLRLSPRELADELTLRGMEVSGIDSRDGDVVLDVDVKPNRGDALSMVGLAREVAAFTERRVRLPSVHLAPAGDLTAGGVRVQVEDAELCPRFVLRTVGGIGNGQSPSWMADRLRIIGLNPVSAVVDVTNYVMHELGQPMHAYDAGKISGSQIVVRRARPGERLETIDHRIRHLDESMLVIADSQGPIGLAGIMGGAGSELSADTVNVLLEAAIFNGPAIRRTGRRLALRTDASARFEKGISLDLPRVAVDRAAQLIAEITGGNVAAEVEDSDSRPRPRRIVAVRIPRVERLLGLQLNAGRMRDLLSPLELEVVDGGDGGDGSVNVAVPPHRLDIVDPADIVEEVARTYGYQRIPPRLPSAPLPPYRPDPSAGRHRVRRILAGFGLNEVVMHALIGPEDLSRCAGAFKDVELVRLANPVNEEHSVLRPGMLPSMLMALQENVHWRRRAAWLFEVGKGYWAGNDTSGLAYGAETAGTGRFECWRLGIGLLGPAVPPGLGERPREADVADLKGLVEALHQSLGAPLPTYLPGSANERNSYLHPGRSAQLAADDGQVYGWLGELHPLVAEAWDLPDRPVLAEVNMAALLERSPANLRVKPVPAVQPLDRDLAVVLDESVPVGDLLRAVRASAGTALVDLRLFDVYRGEQVRPGRVSYALALRFQPESPASHSGDDMLSGIRKKLVDCFSAEFR